MLKNGGLHGCMYDSRYTQAIPLFLNSVLSK